MAATLGKTVNTVTDPGVIFGVGNALLNFHAAGIAGLVFNFASITVCCLLRARAELGTQKNSNRPLSSLSKILDHRGTSLEFAALTQLGVAVSALFTTGLTIGAVIPFLFSVGNLFAALSSEPALFESLREKMTRRVGRTAATVVTVPEIWSASGLILTANALLPAIMFVIGGALAVFQSVRKTPGQNASNPFLIVAAGNFMAAAINLPSSPLLALITSLFGLAFLSICALRKYGGIAEAVCALWTRIRSAPRP